MVDVSKEDVREGRGGALKKEFQNAQERPQEHTSGPQRQPKDHAPELSKAGGPKMTMEGNQDVRRESFERQQRQTDERAKARSLEDRRVAERKQPEEMQVSKDDVRDGTRGKLSGHANKKFEKDGR
ncbi:MAG: hypothetical protein AAGA36_01760 [Pseudomonadota bacterium]